MSISNILKSSVAMVLGGLIGYGSIKYIQQDNSKNRSIASYPIAKMGAEQNSSYVFDVKLVNNDVAASDSGISAITMRVTALKDLHLGLNYNWNIPEDVEIVEGNTSDSLGEFKAGEVRDFTLKLKSFSKQLKKYVSFEIQGIHNQKPVRREILVSTRIEDSLEYLVQQNAKKPKNSNINKLSVESNRFNPENVVK